MIEKEEKGTIFSECRQYRYSLWRIKDSKKPLIGFIGLNPSKADENNDDNTVTWCRNYIEKNNDYGGFYMMNLFAYVSTKSSLLKQVKNPISLDNNYDNNNYLCNLSKKVKQIIVCWGNYGSHNNRSTDVLNILKQEQLYCLKINKTGEPRHPSRLSQDCNVIPYTRSKVLSQI